jgi:hypothetical protein
LVYGIALGDLGRTFDSLIGRWCLPAVPRPRKPMERLRFKAARQAESAHSAVAQLIPRA